MPPRRKKKATFKSSILRLNRLSVDDAKNIKLNTIINIGENNGYNKEFITWLYNQIKNKKQSQNKQTVQKKIEVFH
jgi:hypothetical protein